MTREIDNYFLQQPEPIKSYLLALREYILAFDSNITEAWRYRMPFYCYNGKRFCYLWVHKKYKQPYLGLVNGKRIDHPKLIAEKRARMMILLFDPEANIPLRTIRSILRVAIQLCH
jgi:Domain of unknown function (DU1801)